MGKTTPTKLKLEDQEKNLKIQYENLRKCIDIQITSLVPEQDKIIKTYLWFNVTMFGGFLATIFKLHDSFNPLLYSNVLLVFAMIIFVSYVVFSITYCIYSIYKGAQIGYGSMEARDFINNAISHTDGILLSIEISIATFDFNREVITNRAKAMRIAFRSLSVAFTALVFFSILCSAFYIIL